jgi:ABC-type polysaccharide/polyol phosphate export permease
MYDAVDRNLLRELTIAQYKLRDQSSFFGFVWSFLNPVLMLGVLFVFFSSRLGMDIEHYPIYLLLGLLLFTHFSNTTSIGMRVLRATRQLTTDTAFPKEFLVLSAVISSALELVISTAICLGIGAVSGVAPTLALLWVPAILVAELVLVAWVTFFLAALYPFAWDIDHIYHVFLRALLFVTPIFYAESFVGEGLARVLLRLNPLAQVIAMLRTVVLHGESLSPVGYALFMLPSLVLLGLGFALFKQLEPRFAEYV